MTTTHGETEDGGRLFETHAAREFHTDEGLTRHGVPALYRDRLKAAARDEDPDAPFVALFDAAGDLVAHGPGEFL